MASQIYEEIREAFRKLNPKEVRQASERRLKVGLVASSRAGLTAMEDALVPATVSRERRKEILALVHRVDQPEEARGLDLLLCEEELLCPPEAFGFRPSNPLPMVREVLDRRPALSLSLARSFQPFRRPVIGRLIRTISRENAVFALLTALPDVFPNLVELPWAVGEFASDTAFITMNQVRMTFLIAAASDREIGFREQRTPIAAIVSGAFGWRAIARELVGKIPFGGGLAPKAAIAYAGTYTMGMGLERFYRIGYWLTRRERQTVYEQALASGKRIVSALTEQPPARSSNEIRAKAVHS